MAFIRNKIGGHGVAGRRLPLPALVVLPIPLGRFLLLGCRGLRFQGRTVENTSLVELMSMSPSWDK